MSATSIGNTTEALWKSERDPILNFGKWLTDQGVASKDELDRVGEEVRADAAAAVEYALAARYPDTSEVTMHVYAETAA
jgi:acetoin:2,6-dichlorophenolindophenol oxidoreductase subunit alpha